jgi:hypothetical protein
MQQEKLPHYYYKDEDEVSYLGALAHFVCLAIIFFAVCVDDFFRKKATHSPKQ